MDDQQAKNNILARIRSGKPALHPLPKVPMFEYSGKPMDGFIKQLVGFDGRVIQFKTREEAIEWLNNQEELNRDKNLIYSSATGIAGNVTEDDLADLANAHKINVCVTEGEMGVGEMGAIWVTDTSLGHAACALLSRRLFILLDSNRIIGGLHEAYASLKLKDHQYGSFYTGPSATADIEAVHITGAQGPLVMTAVLYNCETAPEVPTLMINPATDTSVWAKSMENDV